MRVLLKNQILMKYSLQNGTMPVYEKDENGEYTTIDAEKLKYDVRKAADVFYGGTNS